MIVHEALELFVKWSIWNHGFNPKSRVYENEHKVTQVFTMLKLPYTKSSDGLLETSFIVLSYKDGRVKLAFVFQRYMIPMIPKSESHAHILF